MHFRSAVTSTLAARDRKDLLIVNLMKSRAGLTLLTTSPTQSELALTVITVLVLWFCPYLETFGIGVLRSVLSPSSPCIHTAFASTSPHTLLHCPFPQEAVLGSIFGRIASLDEECFFFSLHCCLSYNMLLQMSECFVGITIYSKCNTPKKCKISSKIPGDELSPIKIPPTCNALNASLTK